jgi:chromosome segregation ATPase
MNTLTTISTRLDKKRTGLTSDEKKIENLNAQITQYKNSVTRLEDGLVQKRAEVALLEGWKDEAEELTRKSDTLGTELEAIRAHFDQFTWTPNQPYEEKLESSGEYKEKLAERVRIENRLTDIEKLANKTYYRR